MENKGCPVRILGDKTYRCHFELALQVMGGKWKPIILYHLGASGVMRFSDLSRSMPDVTDRMLTRQLRELEADGLISRKVYRQVPPKVEYSLTPMGQGLFPLLLQMRDWGLAYEQAQAEPGQPAARRCEPQPARTLHPSYAAAQG